MGEFGPVCQDALPDGGVLTDRLIKHVCTSQPAHLRSCSSRADTAMQLHPGLKGTQRAGGGPTVSVLKASESRGKVRPTATYDLARICHLWPSMPHTEEGRGEVYFCAILDLIPVKMSHSTPPRSELPGYMLSMVDDDFRKKSFFTE